MDGNTTYRSRLHLGHACQSTSRAFPVNLTPTAQVPVAHVLLGARPPRASERNFRPRRLPISASVRFFLHSGDVIYADGPLLPEVKLTDGTVWRNIVTESKSKVAETLDDFRGLIPAAFCALISLRLAALSLWRSNRRISFWAFEGLQIVSFSQAGR
jgi:hypothetical protein